MQKLFVVEKKDTVTPKDGLYLRNLYQPLISNQATMLYELFLDYYYLNKTYKTYFQLQDLATVLGITHQELIKEKQKLEAVGLIRTFAKADNQHFIIILNKPLSIEKFVKNPLLYKSLIAKIGDEMFERIAFAFKKPQLDKAEFSEVTSKFQDIFSIEEISTQNNTTLELTLPIIKSKSQALKILTSGQFVFYLTNYRPSPSLLKTINEIQQLGFASSSINLIIDYSFEVNGKVVNNHIKKIAKNLYGKDLKGFDAIKDDLESAKRNKLGYRDIIFDALEQNNLIKNETENWDYFINNVGDF